MVSLWGTKKNTSSEEPETNGSSGQHQNGVESEPTERTRLIPASDAGFLDPDDPAVCLMQSPWKKNSY
jgi:hypothetical protein